MRTSAQRTLPQSTAAPLRHPEPLSPQELYRQFDFNHDGKVSREELAHGVRSLQAGGPVGSLVYGNCYSGDALPPAAVEAMSHQCTSVAAVEAARIAATGGWAFEHTSGSLPPTGTTGAEGHVSGALPPRAEVEKSPFVIRVPLPRPTYRGGKQFYGDVPSDALTFAPAELCATPDPEAALAPTPQVPTKRWYNTHLYMPDESRGVKQGGQFLERFVQGPDGEWLDVPKARRMAHHIQETVARNEQHEATRRALLSGRGYSWTGDSRAGIAAYADPYSGERLVAYRHQLLPKHELFEENNVHEPDWKEMLEEPSEWDFANFRIPWPFGRSHRNKKVSQHAYDWFDRQNPFIPSDNSYRILELPSIYVDEDHWGRFRAGGGPTPVDYEQAVAVPDFTQALSG